MGGEVPRDHLLSGLHRIGRYDHRGPYLDDLDRRDRLYGFVWPP
jgi:hypothetical protein